MAERIENQEKLNKSRVEKRQISDRLTQTQADLNYLRARNVDLTEQLNTSQTQNNTLRNQRNIFQTRYQKQQTNTKNQELAIDSFAIQLWLSFSGLLFSSLYLLRPSSPFDSFCSGMIMRSFDTSLYRVDSLRNLAYKNVSIYWKINLN